MQRGRVLIGVAAFSLMLAASPAPAQTVTAEDWSYFLRESYSQYGDADPFDLEDALFAQAKVAKSRDSALAAFARRLNTSPRQAEDYADLIIDSVRARASCRGGCDPSDRRPLYERAAAVGLEEPSGGLLLSFAKNVAQDGVTAGDAELIRLLVRHRAAKTLLAKLVDYNEDPEFMIAYLASLPSSAPDNLPAIVPGLDSVDEDRSGWFDAMIEASEERLADGGSTPDVQAGLAQLALSRMLRLGLTREAVERYFRYPSALRARLPIIPRASNADDRGCERRQSGYRFADDLAAALWLDGHKEEARLLAERAKVEPDDSDRLIGLRRGAMLEGMAAARPDAQLFDLLFDFPTRGRERTDARRDCDIPASSGWYDALHSASPGLVELVSRRLVAAGHSDIVAHLRSRGARDPAGSGGFNRLAFLFPADIEARQKRWAAAIDAARGSAGPGGPAAAEAPRSSLVHPQSLDPWWVERPLPTGMRPGGGETKLPKGVRLPVAAESVLRFDSAGGEHALVYQSGELDLPGETGAYGFWFVRTRGGKWTKPLYLGLKQYFPYMVVGRSNLPLLDGETLRIEAKVREIDPASISFPPVGLTVRRLRDGVFLEMNLARVAADRDSDGLTDIEERAIGLDFTSPDTDGDGLADGVDPLPLTPRPAVHDPVRAAVAASAVMKIFGHDAGAISIRPAEKGRANDLDRVLGAGSAPPDPRRRTIFLVASEDLFAGFAEPNLRLLLYSKAGIEALLGKGIPFYAPAIVSHFRSLDGLAHYFVWSARWVGGTFLVRCDAAGASCGAKEYSAWIT